MCSNLDNFKAWHVNVLEGLYGNRDAGIAVLMISLPLLERYLRRKHNLGPEDKLSADFMDGFRKMFPALPTTDAARALWSGYRNGLLHQATLARATKGGAALPGYWLTHDIDVPVRVEADGSFTVHPVLFSQVVIHAILEDFSAFEADAPALPQVARRDPVGIPSQYMGTRSG